MQAVRAAVPLVQVPPRGLWGRSGPVAHTSLDVWLGEGSEAPAMTLEDLVRRYLRAFGPASVLDAQAWSGLTRLAGTFDRLRPELLSLRDERGRELFDLPDAPRPDPDHPAPPRYLYDFDNLLLSHADRRRVVGPEDAKRLSAGDGPPAAAFLLDGSVAGSWRLERASDRATLRLEAFRTIGPADAAALVAEGERLAAFLVPATAVDVRFTTTGAG